MTNVPDNTRSQRDRERFLDTAATHAVGALTLDEADAYLLELATADPADQKQAQDLSRITAQLAAASPYMDPPARLRDAVLTATAPANFKIADYRRPVDPAAKWVRWGLVAAIVFLTASAFYTSTLKAMLRQTQNQLASAVDTNKKAILALQQQSAALQQQNAAVAMLTDPEVRQVDVLAQDNPKNKIGKLLVDSKTGNYLLVMPKTLVAPGAQATVTLMDNGKRQDLKVAVVGDLGGRTAMAGTLATPLVKPESVKVNDNLYTAGMK
jgi:hypothetical protein